ncbi:Cytochrome P450 [Macleaya cordata]|uniref:Cytochrome P450 n=1 Tax=Macleaya cordata TaxID=56857 RepID=A0A200PP99_MACCD|nr:Cytochrome P450 [Macleaya cordata]
MANNTTTTTTISSSFLTLRPDSAMGVAGVVLTTTTLPTTSLIILASICIFLIQFGSNTHKKRTLVGAAAGLPPGPVPWPIIGNLPELFRNKPAFRWILGIMKEMNTEMACIRLGNVHVIPVTSPEIAREFLKKQDAIFASRPITMGTEYSSRGFLSVAVAPWGDQWKKMRRVVASEVITSARLKWLLEKRTEEADNLVFYIHNQCKKSRFDLKNSINGGAVIDLRLTVRQYSGNVIRKMMFNKRYFGEGRKDGGPSFEEEEHVDALFTVLSFLYAFCVSDYLPCLRWLDLDGHEKIMKKAIRVVNKYHDPIIDERIRQWRSDGFIKEPEDLLDVLISLKDVNGKPLLSTEEIKAQTADLIYASVDNPANAIEWAMAEMINNPDILRKAVEEIDMVVGKDRLVQESDFSQLNYVKACAREAFRLHPIAPFNLPHVSNSDTTVAGYFIPKGSHVLLSRTGLGRNPKVWDEPFKFKPERHLKDGLGEVDFTEPDLRFISFSTGRRGCMGAPLGSAMTFMLLARLLQGFSWSVPPGESMIDLSESANDLSLAKPLLAYAKPRLPLPVYPMFSLHQNSDPIVAMANNTISFFTVQLEGSVTRLAGIFLSITTSLLVLASIFIFFIQFRSYTHKIWTSLGASAGVPLPPGPVPWPIIGNLPELFRNKPAFRWILGIMKEMNTEMACIRLGNVHVIPVTSPEIAQEFLKKQDAIFASRPATMGTEYSSRGFLSVAVAPWGDQWKKMRRVVASEVITSARLKWLLEKRTEEADNLVFFIHHQCKKSSLKNSINGGAVIDLRLAVRQYSGNVIRKMMFNKRYFGEGRKDGGPGFEEEEHVDALFTVLSLLYAFAISDYLPCLRWLDLDGHEKVMKKAIRVVNKYHDPIIDERIRRWRSDGFIREPEDLLDVLVSLKDVNGKPLLSTEEIKAQTDELLYATVDNPSNAVEWAMAEMINQPDILRKAVEEIDTVVGKDRLVQESDFSQLNYVKACVKEAFRLHPIAPFNLPHVSSSDTTVAGYFIPKGSHVLLSRIGLGRNPKVWDEPLKFKPERHLKDGSAEVDLIEPDLRLISFSTGRRGCMGAPLGSAMTIMLLARLLQGFSWTVPPGETKIDLSESTNDLFLAKPLRAHAKPRLPSHVYPK